jgi:hypothetical protein
VSDEEQRAAELVAELVATARRLLRVLPVSIYGVEPASSVLASLRELVDELDPESVAR